MSIAVPTGGSNRGMQSTILNREWTPRSPVACTRLGLWAPSIALAETQINGRGAVLVIGLRCRHVARQIPAGLDKPVHLGNGIPDAGVDAQRIAERLRCKRIGIAVGYEARGERRRLRIGRA